MAKRETSGQITELERGRRYSIRVRLAPDENHKSWHWSKSRKVNGNKAEATAALVAYKQELEDERSGKNVTVGSMQKRSKQTARRWVRCRTLQLNATGMKLTVS